MLEVLKDIDIILAVVGAILTLVSTVLSIVFIKHKEKLKKANVIIADTRSTVDVLQTAVDKLKTQHQDKK